MKLRKSSLRNEKGFTLIEMAIVLVIIGLILGAVIKGKDVINSAKQKKFYTNFIKTWEIAAASYYDRTGNLLGDGTTNGGAGTPNGLFDGINSTAEFVKINNRLKAVGLEIPTSNTGNNYQYTYSGVYSGSRTISLQLITRASVTDGVTRNTFYFTGMPTDLALALDTVIDGQADPRAGSFRSYPDNPTGGVWPDASKTKSTTVDAMYIVNVP